MNIVGCSHSETSKVCPAGFTLIGSPDSENSFCIDNSERPTQTWQQAVVACGNLSTDRGAGYLCSYEEWLAACNSGTPNGMIGNIEWTSELFGHNGHYDAVTVGLNNCSWLGNNEDNISNSHNFRCCLK